MRAKRPAIEETEGLLVRRSGKTDYKGIEIFKDLPPEMIDGTVAFIGNYHIKSFDGDGWIIFNRHRLFESACYKVVQVMLMEIYKADYLQLPFSMRLQYLYQAIQPMFQDGGKRRHPWSDNQVQTHW
jgi:hypothetical protein